MITRNKIINYKNTLISATRITNYVKNDCIIDYLDLIKNKNYYIEENSLKITKKRKFEESYIQILNKKTCFDYIVENGYLFENSIINEIENKMKSNNDYKNLIKINEKDIKLNFVETIKILLEKKHDIILGAVLINEDNNTYGYPDLIVSGKWLSNYVEEEIDKITNDRSKYYIIDIKSSTISLINNGKNVSSKLLYNNYRSQIYVYLKALNKIFSDNNIDNNVNIGLILGKRYQYMQNKVKINMKPFEKLGIIYYDVENLNGKKYDEILESALEWHEDLNKNWLKFTLNPINNDNLYPNMKNNYDKNYHKIKKEIAYKNKEITLLWNCGIKNRNLAWEKNIKRYDDPKLNCKILGFENTAKENILSKMLSILGEDKQYLLNKKNNVFNWQQKLANPEFFVDFETYNKDIFFDDNFIEDNMNSYTQKIYMIGIGEFVKNEFIYTVFIIKNHKITFDLNNKYKCIFCENEYDLIYKFTKYVNNYKKYKLYHWSNAEETIFNKKIIEYNFNKVLYKLNWCDMLKIFKDENYPIVIKECFSYGLKDIVRKLNEYKLLELEWPELDSGLLTSFIAKEIYEKNINTEVMKEIVEYNYIDCIALYKILEWLRKQ